MNNLNVFTGENAVLDFLTPDKGAPTPLVEIPISLNPFYKDNVRIYAKLMNMTPLGNVKSLPALNMLLSDIRNTEINTLIENSSGNTVFSLAVIGRLLGIPHTKAYVSHEVTWGKLQLLRLLGTEIIVNEEPICPDPSDRESGIFKAKIKGKQKGWFNTGQYENKYNPDAHYKWTAPQIWEQTNGKVDVFCTGLGTTGTILGAGGYLKEKNDNIKNIGVVRKPNNPVPGVRTPNLLRQIAFDWESVVDEIVEVGTVESFKMSLELCRNGLLVGPSSGFALRGLLQYLHKAKLKDANCVFVCADSPLPYLNEYFEYLDETNFSKIKNEELLINKPNLKYTRKIFDDDSFDIDVETSYKKIYAQSVNDLWDLAKQGNESDLYDNIVILDVRTEEEYNDAHLPSAVNIDHKLALAEINKLANNYKGKIVYSICRSGRRSGLVTSALRGNKIEAYNIKGGMIEWSRLNYPRVQPEYCRT